MNAPTIIHAPDRTLIALAAIGVALLAAPTASAQSVAAATTVAAPSAKPIDLQAAIGIALQQNVAVQQSENAVASDAAVVSSRKSALLPSLSLNTSTAQSLGRSTSALGTSASTQSMNAGVSSSFVLFDGLRNVNELRQARLDVNASTSDLTRTRQTVVFTVASNYLTLATAQGLASVQRENLAALEAEEAQLQKLVKAGARSISDLYQQQANTESARASLVAADRDVELAKIAVIQTLQLDPRGTYDFVAPQIADASVAAKHYDLDSLLSRAFSSRADLAAEQTRVDASALGTKAAQASRLPTVSVSTSYNASYTSTGALTLADQLSQNRGGSVSVGVSVPIFDRGTTTAAVQQARLQEDNARLALANQRQAIALDVRRAYLTLESTRQQLTVALAQQKAADLAVSTTKARYAVGTSTLLELTQARASQLQAATSVVNARNAMAFQDALMPYYTGELDPTAAVLPK
jgi:outer membrane protein